MKYGNCCSSAAAHLSLICFLLILVTSAGAQLRQTRRVLIINDLGVVSSPGFAEVDQAIFSVLQNSPYQIELYHESLQLIFFPDDASQRAFRESLILKYSERKPDLIIAVGSASLRFIAESISGVRQRLPIRWVSGVFTGECRPRASDRRLIRRRREVFSPVGESADGLAAQSPAPRRSLPAAACRSRSQGSHRVSQPDAAPAPCARRRPRPDGSA